MFFINFKNLTLGDINNIIYMNSWIDEAEKRQKEKNTVYTQDTREESVIIKENIQKIEPFINKLNELIERVSKISPEERKPSLEIGSTHLEGDLRYEFYGSAFKLKEKKIAFLFKKNVNFIFWRRMYVNITDTAGIIKITIYEKGTSQTNQNDIMKQKLKLLSKIESYNETVCLQIIDWLVFKISSGDLKRNLPHLHQ